MNLGECVVYKLSEALEGFYYCLFFDNFFTLVLLLKRLLARKLFACGTIRQNRKLFPETMKKAKLNPGKFTSFRREILAFHNGNILARPPSASLVRGDQEGLFKLVTLNCILNRITGVTFGC
jgi:hypothetical protein